MENLKPNLFSSSLYHIYTNYLLKPPKKHSCEILTAITYFFTLTFVNIFSCWSYIGRRGGRQDLSLRPPDSTSCHCLCDVGRALHEMMHALGFYHEHSRPDRDKFIQIVKKNVKKGKLRYFCFNLKLS